MGLKLNRFHTTALCSPTRQAMLTGRNHHSVGMGAITEMATSAPGNCSIRPKEKAPIAETLKLNGYSTAQFGKCHEVPVWEVSPAGPFHQWPTGSGFEYFYGFVGGEANQYYPGLYEGTTAVEPPKSPEEGYTLTEDLADRAITWVRQQKALVPDKPFFMYFAPGATHAPHQVPKEWSDKYKGKFDDGWDVLAGEDYRQAEGARRGTRERRTHRRHDEIPAWDDMPDELKPVLARQMEIYAGFLEQTDHESRPRRRRDRRPGVPRRHADLLHHRRQRRVGRRHAQRLLQRDDHAQRHAGHRDHRVPAVQDRRLRHPGRLQPLRGRLGARAVRAVPVDQAGGLALGRHPQRHHRALAERPRRQGRVRNQFHHVIDVAPTILEAAGLPAPTLVNGIAQAPLEGVSMLGTLQDAKAPETHEVQYFEMMGNRGIYHQGWTAVTKHRTPWKADTPPPFDTDVWELYGPDDWTQAHDLAAENPEKLAELQRLWLIEAVKYNVVPLDDRGFERINPDIAGRPQLIRGNTQLLFDRMRVSENCVLTLKNKSYSVTANIVVPESGANGVIVTQGGSVGGWSLYAHEGKLKYCFNFFGIEHYITERRQADPGRQAPGADGVRLRRRRPGQGRRRHAVLRRQAGRQRAASSRPMPMGYSADEACDVGSDTGSPASPDYGPTGNRSPARSSGCNSTSARTATTT